MPNPELDIEDFSALLGYLRAAGRIGAHETPAFTRLAGGVSNRTVLVERPGGDAWVMKQALRRLRVSTEWLSDPARILREADGMRRLAEIAPVGAITRLVFVDSPRYLLAMDAVPQPHENWKVLLLAGCLEVPHVEQFARLLAAVHRGGWDRRAELSREFDDRSFFESLRVEPYYLYTADRVPDARQFLHALAAETRATRYTLVHGDYSPKNVLVHQGRLILLDHEVIHFGDGAFDLGFSLAHLLSKAHHLPAHRAQLAEGARRYWQVYATDVAGFPWAERFEPRAVRHTLGCLLARCEGRSPLEYLTSDQRRRQTSMVVELMRRPPKRVDALIDVFLAGV